MNIKCRMHNILLIGIAFQMLTCSHSGYAQDTNNIDRLKRIYDFASWEGKTKEKYDRIISNWKPNSVSMPMAGLKILVDEQTIKGNRSIQYIFNPMDSPEVTINVRILECKSITEAHQAMIEYFSICSAPHPFPLGSENGIDLGDRCYTGYSKPKTTSIVFVRNNAFIRVFARDTDYSVANVAKQLDEQLKKASKNK